MYAFGRQPSIPMVHSLGPWGYVTAALLSSDWASGTWPGANVAYFYPVLVPTTCVARRLWWANGSSVSASYNIDCGIYRDAGHLPGALLVSSGNTAQGTASQVQFVDITDTTLAPGLYWLALVSSSASATIQRVSANQVLGWKYEQGTASPLPSSATPVESSSGTVQLFGFATTASP